MQPQSTSNGGVNTPSCYFTTLSSKSLLHPGVDLQIILQPVNNWFLYIEPTIHLDVKYIYIYIYYYFIEKICSLSHFFSNYASPSLSKLQSSPLSTLYTSPWPQSSKLFSLSTFPHDPHDFRWWVMVMAQIKVWVNGCGWSLGWSMMGCMIIRWLDQ